MNEIEWFLTFFLSLLLLLQISGGYSLKLFFIRCYFFYICLIGKRYQKNSKKEYGCMSTDFNYRFAPDSSNSTVKLWLIFQSFQKFIHKLYFCIVWMWIFCVIIGCGFFMEKFFCKLIDYFNPYLKFIESPSNTLVTTQHNQCHL